MNFIKIAKETIKITQNKCYDLSDKTIKLLPMDFEAVEVYSPQRTENLTINIPDKKAADITVVNMDSFQAASEFEAPLVMNFANAYVPGGGFKMGSPAQEESLCRCSTLYASISSKKAFEMYRYNRTKLTPLESDYMLLSPQVCVFRDEKCQLLNKPFSASVITLPAPNRRGSAMLASENSIEEAFIRRIEILCKIAAENGYKNLVLGAWGCGAFGNDPQKVAEYFHTVLLSKGYAKCFEKICFAIYGDANSPNYTAFSFVFS